MIGNFVMTLKKGDFTLFFKNSTVVATLSTIVTVITNTMAGYASAKYQFEGRSIIFTFFISTLMLPLEVLVTPIFQMVKFLGMYNTFLKTIVPPAATPAGVFLLRQYLLSMPDDLIETTRTDGASETGIFVRLMLPVAKPAMSVLAISSSMWKWNDFMWPLLVIRDTEKCTLQLTLPNFNGQYSVDWNSLVAMSVVTMVPVPIVFLIFQRQFIRGMATNGMEE